MNYYDARIIGTWDEAEGIRLATEAARRADIRAIFHLCNSAKTSKFRPTAYWAAEGSEQKSNPKVERSTSCGGGV